MGATAGSLALLTVDRGNTTLDLLLHTDPPVRVRLPATEPARLEGALAAMPRPRRAVGATVVRGGLDPLARLLAGIGVRLELAGVDLPCPLPTRYAEPGTLGVDRWVTALAAHRELRAAVVVDCGTAVTVDAVAADGTFLGGAIAPGLAAMALGLATAAPALPAFDRRRQISVPATSSSAAVDAGVMLAFAGAVERLVAEIAPVLGGAPPVLITGGDAEVCLRHGRLQAKLVPDLLHRGLRWLAEPTGASAS